MRTSSNADIDVLCSMAFPRNAGQAEIMDELIDVKKSLPPFLPNRAALFTRLKKARVEGQPPRRCK